MKIDLKFPENLYSDVRISEKYSIWYYVKNGDIDSDSDVMSVGAMIRVFDGNLWYTASTNDISNIQAELDSLALLATPNPDIYNHPFVKILEVNKDSHCIYDKENDARKLTRDDLKKLTDNYIQKCIDDSIPEMTYWGVQCSVNHETKSFYSSKGACIEQDMQALDFGVGYGITIDGITTYTGKSYTKFDYNDLWGHEKEILEERNRYYDYAKNAVDVTPGEYECVLAPVVTAVFTHESFGHKSEADFMLNDEVLRNEWVMGKKVGSSMVSICDDGSLVNNGYVLYDDEGTKARKTWLIKNGILTGRLHDAKSATTLNEELTGNSRAQDIFNFPIVRMTNTYMEGGSYDPQKMIEEVKDGIYVHGVSSGTGQATFTMRPTLCYRIREGKLCEPLRVNVINGTVFQTLFDIDAVGNDFELHDTGSCGKNGQIVSVSAGGPSIRVKKLTIN